MWRVTRDAVCVVSSEPHAREFESSVKIYAIGIQDRRRARPRAVAREPPNESRERGAGGRWRVLFPIFYNLDGDFSFARWALPLAALVLPFGYLICSLLVCFLINHTISTQQDTITNSRNGSHTHTTTEKISGARPTLAKAHTKGTQHQHIPAHLPPRPGPPGTAHGALRLRRPAARGRYKAIIPL